MATEIQIRNVPESMKLELKRRAREEGLSLSQYMMGLIKRELAYASPKQFAEMLRESEPVELSAPAGELVRAARRAEGGL